MTEENFYPIPLDTPSSTPTRKPKAPAFGAMAIHVFLCRAGERVASTVNADVISASGRQIVTTEADAALCDGAAAADCAALVVPGGIVATATPLDGAAAAGLVLFEADKAIGLYLYRKN